MSYTKLINTGMICFICMAVISGCDTKTTAKVDTKGGITQTEQKSGASTGSEIEIVKSENTIDVKVTDVTEGEFKDTNKMLAEVFPNTNVSIFSKINGTVSQILVKKGDTVKKGQVIAKLDQTEALLTVKQAEASLSVATANLEQANTVGTSTELAKRQLQLAEQTYANAKHTSKQGIELAQINYDRIKSLYEKDAISKGELDQAQTTYLQAKTQYENQLEQADSALIAARTQVNQANKGVRIAKANVTQGQVEVSLSKNALENTLIRSTVDGIVTDLGVEVGDAVHAQKSLATIINLNPVIVKVNVSENMLSTFKKGTQLDIQIPSQSVRVKGNVAYVGLNASEQSRLFPIEVEVPNPKGELLAGMKAEVYTSKGQAGTLIPTDAIIERGGKAVVYVVNGERVVQKEITITVKGTDQTLIASGVKPGEKIVIKGQSQLQDGSKIRLVP